MEHRLFQGNGGISVAIVCGILAPKHCQTCPSCRAERGYSETMLIRGLDSFLLEVKSVIETHEGDNGPPSQLP